MPCVQQLYSNAATALHFIDQWKKVPVAMQNRNQALAPKGSHLHALYGSNSSSHHFSRGLV